MSDALPLRPLRIPSGWTLRHNSFVEAPVEHEFWNYDGNLLLAYHAEWDLLVELTWVVKLDATRGVFLLRVLGGDRRGRKLHGFESRDAAAVVAELEHLFDEMTVRYAPRIRHDAYESEEVYMLIRLWEAMHRLRSEDPAFDACCRISDVFVEDKLAAIAPMAARYWQSLDPETKGLIVRIETDFCPHVLRLRDWTDARRENEDDLAAGLNARFRSGPSRP